MKKARISIFLFIILVAFAMTVNEDSPEEFSSEEENSPGNTLQSSNAISRYLPSLSVFSDKESSPKEISVKAKRSLIQRIGAGKGPFKLGVSKEKDMPKLGPGAFVYLRSSNAFAVLDNENDRINFYPADPNGKASSIDFPPNRQALGLSVDPAGKVTMLSRQFDPDSGASFPYYEIWKLGGTHKSQWQKSQNFSFSDRATHGAAQSLEMQAFGNTLIFKGLGENEFHALSGGQTQTLKLPGFPTRNDSYIRTQAIKDASGHTRIQIQEFNREGIVKSHNTGEDMSRLTSYRMLPNGLLALDLEADNEKQIPREVVMINPKTGQVKARSALKAKDDIHIDQDVYYDNSRVYQLAEGPKENSEKANFEILQTEFGEE